jgi:hypothetical protein
MALSADEFIRRFLLTVPHRFHRIRHIGFLANGHRSGKLAVADPCRLPRYQDRGRRNVIESASAG